MQRLISQGSQEISMVPSAKALEKDTTSVRDKTDNKNLSKDFLSILFEQIKTTAKKSTTQETLLHDTTTMKATNSNISLEKLSKSSSELLLSEILNIFSLLKKNNTKMTFPKFTDTMQSLLKKSNITDTNALFKELKSIKNVSGLIAISKKYKLGLENIIITSQKIETLQKDFPKLDLKQFFGLTEKSNQNHPAMAQNNESKTSPKILIEPTVKVSNHTADHPVQKTKNSLLAQNLQKSSSQIHVQTMQQESPKDTQEAPKNILQTLLSHREEKSQKVIVQNRQIEPSLTIKEKTPSKTLAKNHDTKIASKDLKKTTPVMGESKEVTSKTPITTLNLKDHERHITSQDLKKQDQTFEQTKEMVAKASVHDLKIKQESTKATPLAQSTVVDTVAKQHIHKNTQATINTNIINALQQRAISSTQEDSSAITLDHKIKISTSEKLDHVKIDIKNHIPQEMSKTDKTIQLKESFNQFSSNLKDKMEHYKPPIMKLQLSLNPKNLGSVDVTLLHRGNNLHVNITSNANTMSLFTQNQAEFKNSLVNMGFTNLEMNFSDQNQGQHNQRNQGNKQNSNHNFEDASNQTSYDSAMELIVPQYI